MILLNSPHNPTGTVLTRVELEAVATLARRHDLLVVTDEVYEHLVFDHHEHVPISTLPGMAERTLTLSSVGKSWSLTGWKVGWATGPAALVGAVLAAKQWLTFTSAPRCSPRLEVALDATTRGPASWRSTWPRAVTCWWRALAAVGLPCRPAEGTYFEVTDVAALGWDDADVFCDALPGGGRGRRADARALRHRRRAHQVRWTFSKDRDVIEQGLERLARADLTA